MSSGRTGRSDGRGSEGRRRLVLAAGALLAVAAAVAVGFYSGYRYARRSASGHARPAPLSSTPATAPTAPARSTAPHMNARPVAATTGNWLVNPGFEQGAEGWKWLDWSQEWGPFEIADGIATSGSKSAHLAVRGEPGGRPTHVFGVVQEIAPQVFPERMSGRYRVDRWEPGDARKVYLQAVVIATHPEGTLPSTQVRYILEGVTVPPYDMSNARYRFFHSRAQPPMSQWIDFSLPVRQDFLQLWGKVPPPGTALRVLFEARYDDKPAGGSVAADVYYDDLFIGVP